MLALQYLPPTIKVKSTQSTQNNDSFPNSYSDSVEETEKDDIYMTEDRKKLLAIIGCPVSPPTIKVKSTRNTQNNNDSFSNSYSDSVEETEEDDLYITEDSSNYLQALAVHYFSPQ